MLVKDKVQNPGKIGNWTILDSQFYTGKKGGQFNIYSLESPNQTIYCQVICDVNNEFVICIQKGTITEKPLGTAVALDKKAW